MRTIGLSHSVGEKLARFLLELCRNHGKAKCEIRLTMTLTHEEIAHIIGASRETVTRLFKRRDQLFFKFGLPNRYVIIAKTTETMVRATIAGVASFSACYRDDRTRTPISH